jgi:hypothetical protein
MDCEARPDRWPLMRGDTLSNHDWFPFYGHRFLHSKFLRTALMEGRRADVGTAVMLWTESLAEDPAGTLPDCDLELASLARFATIADWLEVKDGVLYGWEHVEVEDAATGEVETRLGHPGFILGVVEEMAKRKKSRDGAREAARLAVKKTRIRKKMSELQIAKHIIEDDRSIHMLAEYFDQSDLFINHDNVRAAMVEVIGFTGEVTQFPQKRRT